MTNTTENIILIGMPGAGKSTLGVVLAKILGYEFIDADLLIQGKLDKTLQKIIDACGPDGFIEVEMKCCARFPRAMPLLLRVVLLSIPTRP